MKGMRGWRMFQSICVISCRKEEDRNKGNKENKRKQARIKENKENKNNRKVITLLCARDPLQ
jgi:hypothetical protein